MKKIVTSIGVATVVLASSITPMYAQSSTGTTSTGTTSTTSTTTSTAGLVITPTVKQEGNKLMVTLPVTATADISGGDLNLKYPTDKLKYESVKGGTIVGSDTLEVQDNTGVLNIVFVSDTNKDSKGDIATLTFTVLDSATGDAELTFLNDTTAKSEILTGPVTLGVSGTVKATLKTATTSTTSTGTTATTSDTNATVSSTGVTATTSTSTTSEEQIVPTIPETSETVPMTTTLSNTTPVTTDSTLSGTTTTTTVEKTSTVPTVTPTKVTTETSTGPVETGAFMALLSAMTFGFFATRKTKKSV